MLLQAEVLVSAGAVPALSQLLMSSHEGCQVSGNILLEIVACSAASVTALASMLFRISGFYP